jgi:hypothetical protein
MTTLPSISTTSKCRGAGHSRLHNRLVTQIPIAVQAAHTRAYSSIQTTRLAAANMSNSLRATVGRGGPP